MGWCFKKDICSLFFIGAGLYQAYFPHLYDPRLSKAMTYFLTLRAFECVLWIVASLLLYWALEIKHCDKIVVVLSALFCWGAVTGFGLTNNKSLEGSICALLVSYFISKKLNIWVIVLSLAALFSCSSTALLILALTLIFNFATGARLKTRLHNYAFFGVLFLVLVVAAVYNNDFLISNGRAHFWKRAFDYVLSTELAFGVGLGSYNVYGPAWEIAGSNLTQKIGIFPWLHNDWLQLLFETGLIGVLAFSVIFSRVFLAACALSLDYAFMVICFGIIMIFQMPLHHAPTIVLSICLVKLMESSCEQKNVYLQEF